MRGLPGARMDAIVIKRNTSTADEEGNLVGNITTIHTGRGTWSAGRGQSGASQQEDSAGRAFATQNSTLEVRCPVAILVGDLVDAMGITWSVTAVQKLRTHYTLDLTSPALFNSAAGTAGVLASSYVAVYIGPTAPVTLATQYLFWQTDVGGPGGMTLWIEDGVV